MRREDSRAVGNIREGGNARTLYNRDEPRVVRVSREGDTFLFQCKMRITTERHNKAGLIIRRAELFGVISRKTLAEHFLLLLLRVE